MTLLLLSPIFSSSSLLCLAHFYVVNLFLQSSHSFQGDSDDDDELLEEEPELATAKFSHIGGVNRIRVGGLLISYQIYIYASLLHLFKFPFIEMLPCPSCVYWEKYIP